MKENSRKILVCGTGFGKVYLRAINSMDQHELAAILGRGGKEAISLSELYNVPYYTSVDDIEEEFDLACVIVPNIGAGGSGSKIAKELLQKGIPTLLEHPIHKNEILECLKVSNGVNFLLNPFYRFTKTFMDYIELLKIIRSESTLLNASLECSINVLYSGLDMLCMAINKIDEYEIRESVEIKGKDETVKKTGESTSFVSMRIGEIPVSLKVNKDVDTNNKDNPMHLYHRIELTFDSGRLCLINTNGPIIWMPFSDTQFNGDVINGIQKLQDFPTAVVFDTLASKSIKDTVENEWVSAAKIAIKKAIEQDETEKYKFSQFQIFVSELWSDISKEIGYTNLKNININKNSILITNDLINKYKKA